MLHRLVVKEAYRLGGHREVAIDGRLATNQRLSISKVEAFVNGGSGRIGAGVGWCSAVVARPCPVDHRTGSRSQILIEATSTVPWKMYSRLS